MLGFLCLNSRSKLLNGLVFRGGVSTQCSTNQCSFFRFFSYSKKPVRARRPNRLWSRRQDDKRMSRLEKNYDKEVVLPPNPNSRTLASAIGVRTIDVLKILIKINACPKSSFSYLDNDLADIVAMEFRRRPVRKKSIIDIEPRKVVSDLSDLSRRRPIVVITGHVNHGKTTLLDTLRCSKIASNEPGNITQRISAFTVNVPNSEFPITFIDTPGHSAFSKMRLYGVKCTDIAILIVSAEAGVQEQTIQSYEYIKQDNTAMIVAINKCDHPKADPNKVREQLRDIGVPLQCYGGDIVDVEISALDGTGIDELLDNILLMAEEMPLHADVSGNAEAEVLDVIRDKNKVVACCILKAGTLKKGDSFIAGNGWGKVKSIYDDDWNLISDVAPGQPFLVSGWKVLCEAGDEFLVIESEKKAKNISQARSSALLAKESTNSSKIRQKMESNNLEKAQMDRIQAIELGLDPNKFLTQQKLLRESLSAKEVPFCIISNTSAGIEALKNGLESLSNEEVKMLIVRTSVGQITQQDIKEAAMVDPHVVIVGYGISLNSNLRNYARINNVQVWVHDIIYTVVQWIEDYLSKFLKPREEIKILASCKVLEIFKIKFNNKLRHVGGCVVTSGTFKKSSVSVQRDGKIVYEGPVKSLQHLKNQVKEVHNGMECGIYLGDGFPYLEPGDIISNIQRIYIPRTISDVRNEKLREERLRIKESKKLESRNFAQ